MLKYVKVDSDGYAYLVWEQYNQINRLGLSVGRPDDYGWVLYRDNGIVFETTDHVLFDNYLKLLLED